MAETYLPRWEVTELPSAHRITKRIDGLLTADMRTLVFYAADWDVSCKEIVVEYMGHDNCIVRRVDEWDAILIADNAPPRETQTVHK